MQGGLCRFFKWLDFANPRPVSTRFAGNVGQYIGQIFLVGQIANHLREAVVLSGKVDINLHLRSLGDEALGSQRMRYLTMVASGGLRKL